MATKKAIKSKTIQGSFISIVGAAASLLEILGVLPLGGASPILAIAGSLYSIFGRLVAKEKIDGLY